MANEDLVDKQILKEFRRGNKHAIVEALNQIHWRSLKQKKVFVWNEKLESKVLPEKTFVDVLTNGALSTTQKDTSEAKNKWTLVTSRKQGKAANKGSKDSYISTIFLYGIPESDTAREIWNLFKKCGTILDIILPKKRDKRNQHFGFVKTTSETEAGWIINNVKEAGGLGLKI